MKDYILKAIKVTGKDENILFWGCLHFGHDPQWEIPLWKRRGFNSAQEHDVAIIQNWNSRATADTVGFLLGDSIFGMNGFERLKSLFNQLQFKELYIMPGNHRAGYKDMLMASDDAGNFQLNENKMIHCVPDYIETYINGQAIVMSHYPILSWNGQGKGAIHLHSHVHGSLINSEIGKLYFEKYRVIETSVELNKFPLTFREVRNRFKNVLAQTPDHHTAQDNNPF